MPKDHKLGTHWRQADITSLEERMTAIIDWLEHTEDLLEMLADDKEIATQMRSAAGALRTRRDDFLQKAEELRAQLTTRDGDLNS